MSTLGFQGSVCVLPTCMLSSLCGQGLSTHTYALWDHFLMAQTPVLPKRQGVGRSSLGVGQAEEERERGLFRIQQLYLWGVDPYSSTTTRLQSPLLFLFG